MFDDSNANIRHIGCPAALDEQFCRQNNTVDNLRRSHCRRNLKRLVVTRNNS